MTKPKLNADVKKGLIKIGITLLILLVAFIVVAYFVGKERMKHFGGATPEEVTASYITAMSRQDSIGIENCLLPTINNREEYLEVSNAISVYMKNELSVTTEGIVYTNESYEDLSIIEPSSVTDVSSIKSAAIVTADIPVSRQIKDKTYDFTCTVSFVTVEYGSKWYILSANFDSILQVIYINEEDYALTWYGNDTFGYFTIPTSWSEDFVQQGDYPEYARIYTATDNRASISTSLYDPSKSIDAIADDLINAATQRLNITDGPSIEDMDVDGQHIKIVSIVYADQNNVSHVYIIRLVTSPIHDNYIHVMELIGQASGIEDVIPYLASLTFTQPVADVDTTDTTTATPTSASE